MPALRRSRAFTRRDLSRIVSVRDELLTWRDKDRLWVIRAGPDPRAWSLRLDGRREGVGRWTHGRPDADGLLRRPARLGVKRDALLDEARLGFARSMATSPRTTAEELHARRDALRRLLKFDRFVRWTERFPTGATEYLDRHDFRSRRWHLLNLWLRVPEGRELFDDLPSLAWLAASSWCFKRRPVRRPLRSLRALVRRPRRRLLRWLDLPEGDGVLRLLRAIRPADLNPLQAEAACRVLRDDRLRGWWLNLPDPGDPETLRLMAYSMPLSLSILRGVNEGERAGGMTIAELLRDTARMLRTVGREEVWEVLGRINSKERLLAEHDRAAREYARLRRRERFHDDIRPPCEWTRAIRPPLVSAPWLRPIANLDELLEEGCTMRHCVASYEDRIAAGDYFVYAVHHPLGRATLGLHRVREGIWGIAELRGACNADVPRTVRIDVAAWLRTATPTAAEGGEDRAGEDDRADDDRSALEMRPVLEFGDGQERDFDFGRDKVWLPPDETTGRDAAILF